jgi:hypothetical protein
MSRKHKITVKDHYYECGDGCCDEYQQEWYVDGELVHSGPCSDNALLAILQKFGIEAELTGLDKDGEEIWTL